MKGLNKVGGLAGAKGQSMGSCTIENSSFTGTVNATGKWVGGILGSGYEADSAPNTPVASVKNCYVAGTISGVSNVGGIFGGEPSCMQCWGNGSGSILTTSSTALFLENQCRSHCRIFKELR